MRSLLYKMAAVLFLSAFYFNSHSQLNGVELIKIDSLKKILLSQKEGTHKVNTLIAFSCSFFQTRDYSHVFQYASEALILSQRLNFQKGMQSL